MTGLFRKFLPLEKTHAELVADSGVDPFHIVVERVLSATEAIINGRQVIMAGTNNYLGLTFDPECIAAACEAAASTTSPFTMCWKKAVSPSAP